MKIVCKRITSQGFDLKEVTTIFTNNFDYSFGGYGLELEKEYIVMGIALYKDSNCLYYLIDTNEKPDWFPYLLFEISDNSLPNNWYIKMNNKKGNSDIYTLWGFKELCNSDKFYDQLVNREEGAIQTYFKRKTEISREEEW